MRTPVAVNEHAHFRRIDARVKLGVSLSASAAVMLPLVPLIVFTVGFGGLLVAAGALPHAATQVRRVRWLLLVLLIVDWAFIGPAFAALISLRLALMTSAFSFLVATTTTDEVRSALERLGLPARGAFAFAEAFAALGLFEREWLGIVEAQCARGIVVSDARRSWRERLDQLTALVVPAVVLATQRAWTIHEAAAARGFGAPGRRPLAADGLGPADWGLLLGVVAGVAVLWWMA